MVDEQFERRLAAILAADVAGYSRLMDTNEEGTLAALNAHRTEVLEPCIGEYNGRIVKTTGDGFLAEFSSVVDAARCAIEIQKRMQARNANTVEEQKIEFRIGVNLGDVIVQDGDVFGSGVNVAARLEGLADPNGICISGTVYDHLHGTLPCAIEDLGPQLVKNIARPIQVFRLRMGAPVPSVVDLEAPVPGFQGRPAIAVLPLQNISPDPDQEYFADGLAEDILTRLAMWRWCPVIARNSSFSYKGTPGDVRRIGRELGARYVLEGSVRKSKRRVRISAQLIDAETGHHVWADRYDRALDDIFALQDEITEAIVASLEPSLGHAEVKRTRLKPPSSLDAWELHLRGMWHTFKATKADFGVAQDLLRRSIEIDPDFAGAHSVLAITCALEVMLNWVVDPQDALHVARDEAYIAIGLDAADAWGHTALCLSSTFFRDYEDAIAAGRRATELNPSLAAAHYFYGVALLTNGQPREAIGAMTKAVRLSSKDPGLFAWVSGLGFAHYMDRDYDKAAELTSLAVREAPHNPPGQRNHACTLAQLDRFEEAKVALDKFLELTPGFDMEAARRSVPLRKAADFEHFLDGLRKAGWTG